MELDERIENAAKAAFPEAFEDSFGNYVAREAFESDPIKAAIQRTRAAIRAFQKGAPRMEIEQTDSDGYCGGCPFYHEYQNGDKCYLNCEAFGKPISACPGPGTYSLDPVMEEK